MPFVVMYWSRTGHGCLLEPLVVIPIPKASYLVVHIDDEDSPMLKQFRKILDCE
jgi:hypothetical protein